jgi:hypothetical protein
MLLAARLPIVWWPLLALPGKVWSSSKRLPASLLPPLDGGMFIVMLANYYGASCKSYWLLILPSAQVDMLPESKLFDDSIKCFDMLLSVSVVF